MFDLNTRSSMPARKRGDYFPGLYSMASAVGQDAEQVPHWRHWSIFLPSGSSWIRSRNSRQVFMDSVVSIMISLFFSEQFGIDDGISPNTIGMRMPARYLYSILIYRKVNFLLLKNYC